MSRRILLTLAALSIAQLSVAQPHARFERLARDLDGQSLLSTCEEGTQPSGALYRICVPDLLPWNGDLFLYAHGYTSVTSPLALAPETGLFEQFITATGGAFAASSFRANGLAALPAIEDLRELLPLFEQRHGAPSRVLVLGASQGGLITTLAVERFPDEFAGGLAMCAPNGDFAAQVDYFGDFRVVFDHFLPGVIPGSPVEIPQSLIDGFDAFLDEVLLPAIRDPANAAALDDVLAVTKAPVDAADPTTREQTITGLVWYNVFATNDATLVLGGQPFDNVGRVYSGSSQDEALNALVARFAAEANAREEVEASYQSTGRLSRPLVTLHTTGDEIVPFSHVARYSEKASAAGSAGNHTATGVERYGHCNFELLEMLEAYGVLLALLAGAGLP